jgi:hypothetical protein
MDTGARPALSFSLTCVSALSRAPLRIQNVKRIFKKWSGVAPPPKLLRSRSEGQHHTRST